MNLSASGLNCAVIDLANQYAYFGTGDAPGNVIKVALGAGSNPPTVVATVPMAAGEKLAGRGISTANGSVLWHEHGASGLVVKVNLGAGSNPPVRVGSIAMQPGEDSDQRRAGPPRAMHILRARRRRAVRSPKSPRPSRAA